MSREIERKFIIPHFPAELEGHLPQTIEQGYLALEPGGQEVRLRKTPAGCWLTVKSAGDMVRSEYETALTSEQFQALWPGTLGRRIQKDRYQLVRKGYFIEVDVYRQPLRGLILAEVEFSSISLADSYEKESWMGQEVTHLSFLKNRNLLSVESMEGLMGML